MDAKTIVRVVWLDPHSVDAWCETDNVSLNLQKEIISVGFLIADKADYICLCLNLAKDGEVSCSMVIPRFCIVSLDEYVLQD